MKKKQAQELLAEIILDANYLRQWADMLTRAQVRALQEAGDALKDVRDDLPSGDE